MEAQVLEQQKDPKLRRSKMTEETKKQAEKVKKVDAKVEEKTPAPKSDSVVPAHSLEAKVEHKHPAKSDDKKETLSEKKEDKAKKALEKPKVKKYEAVAYGSNLHISKKHGMFICSFIKNKSIDLAISQLREVIAYKRAIPFKGEIPHRKGKGMMSGRYPINASIEFINLLKGLKGNVISSGLDLDKTRIYIGSTSWAARPQRAGGKRAKRSNVILKAKEFKMGAKK